MNVNHIETPPKQEWLEINFKLINEDLFDIYTESPNDPDSKIDSMDGVQLSTINQSIHAFLDKKDLHLMTDMIKAKFDSEFSAEEGIE